MNYKRLYGLIVFLVSGVVGAILTFGTVKIYVKVSGRHPAKAQIPAPGIAFIGGYAFRKILVSRKA